MPVDDAVGVVIVHRDQPDRCARTIDAFHQQGVAVKITVVDNGSAPAALHRLFQLAPGTTVVRLGYNSGFGPGANAGLRRWLAEPGGEWVAIAPHDALPAPGCLVRLLSEVADRPDAGLVSAEFGPGFDFTPAVDWVIGGYYRPAPRGTGWQDVDYPHGTLLLARRSTLVDVGLFDERYFAYCEEVDLGLRARRRGWQVGMVWGAIVVNDRLPDRTVADYLQLRNTLLLVRTWFGRYPATVRGIYAALKLTGGRDRRRSVEWRAIADFLLGHFGPPPEAVVRTATRGRERTPTDAVSTKPDDG
jgi:N-acetylglucosaminyl-diphospho-decaprenol L-rhamnosyltransferase